jgi:hypothetical protein
MISEAACPLTTRLLVLSAGASGNSPFGPVPLAHSDFLQCGEKEREEGGLRV